MQQIQYRTNPDSKVHGANMGPTRGPMLAPWTLLSGKAYFVLTKDTLQLAFTGKLCVIYIGYCWWYKRWYRRIALRHYFPFISLDSNWIFHVSPLDSAAESTDNLITFLVCVYLLYIFRLCMVCSVSNVEPSTSWASHSDVVTYVIGISEARQFLAWILIYHLASEVKTSTAIM